MVKDGKNYVVKTVRLEPGINLEMAEKFKNNSRKRELSPELKKIEPQLKELANKFK